MKNSRIFVSILFTILSYSSIAQNPIAAFSPSRYNVCSGTSIQLTNTSSWANSYRWFVEGIHYSDSEHVSVILYDGCYSLQEIRLVALDTLTGLSDTTTRSVEVFDSCFFHWTGTFLNCPGDTITLGVNTEEIGTQFNTLTPITIVSGCLTCPSIQFVLMYPGTIVDRTSTYIGKCTEVTSYEYFCVTSGISENDKNQIDIFPNPAQDNLVIKTTLNLPAKLTILDYNGRTLYTHVILEEKTNLDISILSAGAYLIQVLPPSGIPSVHKLIKAQ
ncbi:MAG: T9SS type A sorting domain-containing protein [Bacteroidia bacterium]|nr:T9SS type A sorting domain-containing protein [Bacteroidia bacterium]